MKAKKIEIEFPFLVDFPPGFEDALSEFVNLVCKRYEEKNPGKVMWPASQGAKPIWNEPFEPTYDDSIYQISVFEKNRGEK